MGYGVNSTKITNPRHALDKIGGKVNYACIIEVAGCFGLGYIMVKKIETSTQGTNQVTTKIAMISVSISLSKTYSGKTFQILDDHSPTSVAMSVLINTVNEVECSGYSVAFKIIDTKTGQGIFYNANTKLYSASTVKATYVAALVTNHSEVSNSEVL